MTTDSLPKAAGPEYLTDALRRSGTLGDGRVCGVVVESARTTELSCIIRLRLTYEPAVGDAPSSLILKTARPDRVDGGWNGGRHEVAFYDQVASAVPLVVAARCFEAFADAATHDWHLLLEDLSDSHVIATAWPLPPTMEQCEQILQAHARFHAAWWDDPRLGASVGTWTDAEATERHLETLGERFARFIDFVGDGLSRERRALFERLLHAGPRLLARYHTHRNVTIVQGDAHVWNSFLPRDGGDDVRLFDWDLWRIDVASDDLAYMMAMHWYPDLRRRMERSLLDRYHAALVAGGVRGYDRGALDDDYRLSVLWHITTPVWQATNDIPPVIWWNNLERILLAVDDLGCHDLLP